MSTRPPVFSPEDVKLIERFERVLQSRGGTVAMRDDRLNKVHSWFLMTIGSALVVIAGWGVNSINRLNETMTRVLTENTYRDQNVRALEARFERHLDEVVRPLPGTTK